MEHIGNIKGFTGNGYYIYPNGNEYEGEFVNGVPEGKGIMRFANNDRYEGDWKEGGNDGKRRISFL